VEESGRRKGTCASLRSLPPVLKWAITIIFLQAKKNLEEREAEQEYSFTPVFYTKSGKESKTRPPDREPQSGPQTHKSSGHRTEHSSHRHRDHDDRPDERRRESRDHAFYSPVGTGSVDSHGHSRYSEHSGKSQGEIRRPDTCYKHHVETNTGAEEGGGYSGSYAEAHREERQDRHHRDRHHQRESHTRRLEPAVEEGECPTSVCAASLFVGLN
jgi:hypothetical protein